MLRSKVEFEPCGRYLVNRLKYSFEIMLKRYLYSSRHLSKQKNVMFPCRTFLSMCVLAVAVAIGNVPGSRGDEDGGYRPRFEMSADEQSKFKSGERQLSTIQEYGKNPRYGMCWTNALARVEEGCRRLTDDEQSRLALAFTNCHLEKLGIHEKYECSYEQKFSECTTDITDRAFMAYTEFFTHTQNLCFFLQNQIWHEKTERTVSRLAESSENVADQLEVAGKMQEEMIQQQNTSLKNQKEILDNEHRMRELLQSQMKDVHEEFEEMKATAKENKMLFSEAFEKVAALQKLVLTEFTGFYSLLFYVLGAVITYLLTSAPRTSGARVWMFLVLFVNICVERVIARTTDDSDLAYERMWLCRQVFCLLALILLLVTGYRYKDFAKINNCLLLDIRKQNSELKNFLLSISQSSSSLPLPSNTLLHPVEGLFKPLPVGCDMADSAEEKLRAIDGHGLSSDSDSDTSFVTVVGGGGKPSSPKSNSTTVGNIPTIPEHESTSEPGNVPSTPSVSARDESTSRLGTPKDAERKESVSNESKPSVTKLINSRVISDLGNVDEQSSAKRRGRPKGSKNRTSLPLSSPFMQPNQPSRYHLRRRSRDTTPSSSASNTPQKNTPSTIQSPAVQEMVKHAVELNERISRLSKVPRVVHRKRDSAFFSSDEED